MVRFTSPCFHPNVDKHGNICLDILKENWSALYEVRTILLSIQSLLGERDYLFCCKLSSDETVTNHLWPRQKFLMRWPPNWLWVEQSVTLLMKRCGRDWKTSI